MARYMRTDLGSGHSKLRPPTVVNEPAKVVYAPIQGRLHPAGQTQTIIRQRHATTRLNPPTVVGRFIADPLSVYFARNKPQPTTTFLRPPVAIDLSPQTYYVEGHLTSASEPAQRIRQRGTTTVLYPPTVVVQPGIELSGPEITLVQIRPPRTMAGIRPPRFVLAPTLSRPTTVHLAYSVRKPGNTLLRPPTVIDVRIYFGPATSLAYSRRGVPKSHLGLPVVIDLSPQVYYLTTSLVRIRPQPTTTFLRPPTDVLDEQDKGTVRVHLSYSSRGKTRSTLRPPVVIGAAVTGPTYPVLVVLAASTRPQPNSILRPPVVVTGAADAMGGILIQYVRRPNPQTRSQLKPPVVAAVAEAYYAATPILVRIRPELVDYRLRAPVVVFTAVELSGPEVTLAPSRRGRPFSRLSPPAVVSRDVFFGPRVELTYSRRPKARYGLAAPAVVFIPEPVLYPISTSLAYSRRGTPKSILRRPPVVGAIIYFGPQVALTYSRRGKPVYELRPPVVIDLRPQVYYLTVALTYSRRGVPKSKLKPPIVLDTRIYSGPVVYLVPSKRGRPKSFLRAPVVIDRRPQTYYLTIWLTYSRRGRPVYELKPPTAVGTAPQTVYLSVNLTYSRRGRPKSILRKPVVIDLRPQTRFLSVNLTYSRRGRPFSQLLPPAVIRRDFFSGPNVSLAYSRRGKAKSFLRKPVIIDLRPQAYYLSVSLAYSRRGRPKSFLRKPVLAAEVFFGPSVTIARTPPKRTINFLLPPQRVRETVLHPIRVTLARNKVPLAGAGLAPPAVVLIPEPVLHPIQVTLAYSLRGKPVYFATGVTLTAFVPERGDVCGFDTAASFVCGTDISDASGNGSTITGGDSTPGQVCGGDQENT